MSDELSLDSVLSGDVEPQVEVQEELTLETEEPQQEETQEETAETETAEEPTASKEEPEVTEEQAEKEEWTFAAVKDERRKRQELEKQLEELKAQKAAPEQEHPDVFDDQQAFVESMRNEHRQELANAKLEMAREFMMDTHDDYEQREQEFIDLAKDNPILTAELRKATNPAKFVYQQAKKHAEFKDMQDVGKMKEKMRAELKAELQAELNDAKQAKSDKVADISPSLAKARASKGEPVQEETLDSIFG